MKKISGISLLQTIMAIGMMGFLAVGIMKMSSWSTKLNKTFEIRNEETYLLNEIRNVLIMPEGCKATLAGRDPSNSKLNTPALPIVKIKSNASTDIININSTSTYGQAKLKIIDAWLDDSSSDVGAASKSTYLFLQFNRGGQFVGGQLIAKKIKINYELNAGVIESCVASASGIGGGGESVWKVNSQGEAYYAPSSIVIGTTDTNAGVEVASKDFFASQKGKGLILKSPDGTKCARFYMSNDLELKRTNVDCVTLGDMPSQLVLVNGALKWSDGVKAKNCKEYYNNTNYNSDPSKGNGSYWIDYDLNGPSLELKVYCNMTTDGGGWTLVARVLGDSSGHTTSAAIDTLTAPNQTTTAKFSDALINQLSFTHAKVEIASIGNVYFQTSSVDLDESGNWQFNNAGATAFSGPYSSSFQTNVSCAADCGVFTLTSSTLGNWCGYRYILNSSNKRNGMGCMGNFGNAGTLWIK